MVIYWTCGCLYTGDQTYKTMNKSIIVLSKRCFNKCLRIKKDYLSTNEDNVYICVVHCLAYLLCSGIIIYLHIKRFLQSSLFLGGSSRVGIEDHTSSSLLSSSWSTEAVGYILHVLNTKDDCLQSLYHSKI